MTIRRQSLIRVPIHFIWVTHDRLPLITSAIEVRLRRYFEDACATHRCAVLALNSMPDHVHLLVNFANTTSMSEFMKSVKGGSSSFVSQVLKPGVFFKWRPHYAALGVYPDDMDALILYIKNQQEHHANGTLWDEYERDYLEVEIKDDLLQ